MNNDINESIINNTSEKNKDGKKNPFYGINILKPIENEEFHEMPLSPTHKSIKNRLFLSPPIKVRRNSKNEIETKNLLRKSSIPKKNSLLETSKKDKAKTINNPNSYKNQNIYIRECIIIIPVRKKKMKDNCNNNNIDDTSNILKFTNQLYENDEHFNKLLISKKNDGNPRNSPKRKKIIKFELDDNVSINKLYKKKISNIFRKKESSDINKGADKRSFTNFIKMRTGYSPKKEREDEDIINKTIRNSNYNQNMFSNYLEFNNKNNKDGDCTTKSVKFYAKSKTAKSKNMNVPDKSLVNEYDKMSKKKTNKKRGSLNSSIKNQTNFCEIPKKKNTSKNKKKLFCLFCCLNTKQNDSDEV